MDKKYLDKLPQTGQRIARNLIKNYGSIAAGARELGIRRPLIYQWMNEGMPQDHADNLKRRGINPRTLMRM